MKKADKGTYYFDTWGDASQFCQDNTLPVEKIINVYKTYQVIID